jgi:hypothetical protein
VTKTPHDKNYSVTKYYFDGFLVLRCSWDDNISNVQKDLEEIGCGLLVSHYLHTQSVLYAN